MCIECTTCYMLISMFSAGLFSSGKQLRNHYTQHFIMKCISHRFSYSSMQHYKAKIHSVLNQLKLYGSQLYILASYLCLLRKLIEVIQ